MGKLLFSVLALLLAGAVWAADHFDAPFTNGVLANGSSSDPADVDFVEKTIDIADVYVFPTGGGERVAFIMTLFPFADSSSRLNPDALYQFKIDTDGDAVEDQVIQVTVDGAGSAQTVSTSGVAVPSVTGANGNQKLPSVVTGVPFNTVGGDGTISVFAGLTDDPFFFDLATFRILVRELRGENTADGDAQNILGFDPQTASDTLAGLNIVSIAVEVPKSALGNGSGQIRVWSTTNLDNRI